MKQKKSTDELRNILKNESNYERFYSQNSENFSDMTFQEIFQQILKENGITQAEAVKRSQLDKYAYQILDGKKKKPDRDKVIMLCIGAGADEEQTRILLLKKHLAPLYAKDERDAVILFGVYHRLSVMDIDVLLSERNLTLLANYE